MNPSAVEFAHHCIPRLPVALGVVVRATAASRCMRRAGIAYKDGLFLNRMISLSVGGAWVDGMLVVKAAAHRVAFNNLITHCDGSC